MDEPNPKLNQNEIEVVDRFLYATVHFQPISNLLTDSKKRLSYNYPLLEFSNIDSLHPKRNLLNFEKKDDSTFPDMLHSPLFSSITALGKECCTWSMAGMFLLLDRESHFDQELFDTKWMGRWKRCT